MRNADYHQKDKLPGYGTGYNLVKEKPNNIDYDFGNQFSLLVYFIKITISYFILCSFTPKSFTGYVYPSSQGLT